jgi:hypothetical protein
MHGKWSIRILQVASAVIMAACTTPSDRPPNSGGGATGGNTVRPDGGAVVDGSTPIEECTLDVPGCFKILPQSTQNIAFDGVTQDDSTRLNFRYAFAGWSCETRSLQLTLSEQVCCNSTAGATDGARLTFVVPVDAIDNTVFLGPNEIYSDNLANTQLPGIRVRYVGKTASGALATWGTCGATLASGTVTLDSLGVDATDTWRATFGPLFLPNCLNSDPTGSDKTVSGAFAIVLAKGFQTECGSI